MIKKLSKIFFALSGLIVLVMFGLFVVHTYLGVDFIRPGRDMMPPVSQFLEPNDRNLHIAIVSDTGTHNNVLERVLNDIHQSDSAPDFIMYLGDLVSDRRPANFYWMLHEIERYLSGTPFFIIPGNHDVEKYGAIDKRFYRSVMGPSYYWFGFGDTLFIAMDSSDKVEEAQFDWLADTLDNIRPLFRHCILFGHMPPKNVPGAEQHRMSDADAARLESIVRHARIDAMFFGHVHYFSKDTFAGIPMYTVPSSGQTPRFTDLGKFGYVTLNINRQGVHDVTPVYVEFSGPKREYLEAWFVRYVFTQRLRELINVLAIAAVVFAVAGLISMRIGRRA